MNSTDHEIKFIDNALNRGKREFLWLSLISVLVLVVISIHVQNELNKLETAIKTKSPKLELQAGS